MAISVEVQEKSEDAFVREVWEAAERDPAEAILLAVRLMRSGSYAELSSGAKRRRQPTRKRVAA